MNITLIQSDIIWENKFKNLEKLGQLISAARADTEIIILPEMFNTGFSMNPDDLSEKPHSITFEWMQSMAEEKYSAICGSYIINENYHYYNRWIFVSPDNEM
jgi:predicted amidohydrolase